MTFPLLLLAASLGGGLAPGEAWPGFRGGGFGLSAAEGLPVEWSETKNLAWKAEIPGYGQSSPVVWGGRIFVSSVEGPKKETLVVSAFDLETGELAWSRRRANSAPAEAHDRMAKAAPTPAVDADGFYVFFESGDLLAYAHDGRELWTKFLGEPGVDWTGNHGLGGSPRLDNGTLYLHVAPTVAGWVAAIEAKTGRELWRRALPPAPSFSTPVVVEREGRRLLLLTAGGGVSARDAASGEEVFSRPAKGGRGHAIPSLTVDAGVAVVASSEAGGTHAFRLDAPSETLWMAEKATTEFSSPLAHESRIYLVNSVGALFALDRETGATLSTGRLPGACWASPIAAEDRLYFFGVDGVTTVLDARDVSRRLAENRLPIEGRLYGAAVVDGSILLRSGGALWRVARR